MDTAIPLIELHDDDDMSTSKEIVLDDDIEVNKVPVVTLEESDEIPIISLDTDETLTNPIVVIDDSDNSEDVSSFEGSQINNLTEFTTISSDDSDVEIESHSALDCGNKCSRSLKNKIASKQYEDIQVQNFSDSCDGDKDNPIPNAASPAKDCRISPLKKKQCEACQKCFTNEYKYQKHVCIDIDSKPFLCTLCTEVFPSKSALIKHSKTHSADKPYVCDICCKAFGDKNVLRMHYNTHTGEKPFACTICDKVFSNTVSLKNHYEMHTGETPYVCDVCLSSFDHKSSLCDHKIHEHNYLTLI